METEGTHADAQNVPRPYEQDAPRLGTHSGVFHTDDVMAMAALLYLFPAAVIHRTRDQAELDACDIILDVGGVYDAEKGRFDHHQKGGAGARENGVLYSSLGLIWRHYGMDVIRQILSGGDHTARVHRLTDERLVQVVDATDNGQKLYPQQDPSFEGIYGMSVSAVISSFNPQWDEAEAQFDICFPVAVKAASAILRNVVVRADAEVRGENLVRTAIDTAKDPRIIELKLGGLKWDKAVIETAPKALFVTFLGADGTWFVQAIPPALSTPFEQRLPLPEAWAALRGEELAAITGVEDAVFCHQFRFIGGAKSEAGALRMAELAIESS